MPLQWECVYTTENLTVNDPRPNIWQLQTQGDSKALMAALQNPDAEIRKRAAAALRILGAVDAIPAIRRAVAAAEDDATRQHLQTALDDLLAEQRSRGPVMSAETRNLINQLETGSPAEIRKAAGVLGKLKDKTASEALVATFNNMKLPASIRLCAAEALLELESAPAVVTLLAALRSQSWTSRRNGAAILGQLKADWAVERLAERLYDDNETVRRTAHAALKHIGTPEAKAALEALIKPKAETEPLQWPKPRPEGNVPLDRAVTQETPAVRSDTYSTPPKPDGSSSS